MRTRAPGALFGALGLLAIGTVARTTFATAPLTGPATGGEPRWAQEAAEPAPAPSEPSEAELDDRTARVAAQLRCPVCRNQSVLESSAELSREMQALIREKLAAGESPEEVKAYFVRSYGDWILLQPEPEGLNLLVYLLPALVLVGGIGVTAWLIARWTRHRAPAGGAGGLAEAPGHRSVAARRADGREGAGRSRTDGGEPGGPDVDGPGPGAPRLSEEDRSWLEEAVRRG